jgi:predicted nicotinamide N-methyase
MITLVAQIQRGSEAASTQAKIRSDLHRESINRTTFLEELKTKLDLKPAERVSSVEYYSAVATRFVGLKDDAAFAEFQQYCKGPTQIVINIVDESRIEADNAPKLLRGRMLNIVEDGLPIANNLMKISSPGEAELGTGLTIWDGSIVLAKYLEANPAIVGNKAVLEVGSGTGIVGIVAGLMGANRSVLTDLQYTLKNLQHNVDKNKPHYEASYNVDVMELDWFNAATYPTTTRDENGSEKNWDVILGADIVWIEELIVPLVNTLVAIAGFQTDVYVAHQVRQVHAASFVGFSTDVYCRWCTPM